MLFGKRGVSTYYEGVVYISVNGNLDSLKESVIDELEAFVKNNTVHIAALTLPKVKAPAIAKEVVSLGIKAIWNFAPTDLNLPKDVTVENVHLAESLMRLSYNLKVSENKAET